MDKCFSEVCFFESEVAAALIVRDYLLTEEITNHD